MNKLCVGDRGQPPLCRQLSGFHNCDRTTGCMGCTHGVLVGDAKVHFVVNYPAVTIVSERRGACVLPGKRSGGEISDCCNNKIKKLWNSPRVYKKKKNSIIQKTFATIL